MAKKLDELKVAANASRRVLENDKLRITEIALRPGQKAQMHNHPGAYAVYAMSDCTFKQAFPDGKSADMNLKKGQAAMMEAGAHEVTNMGNNVGINLVIELK